MLNRSSSSKTPLVTVVIPLKEKIHIDSPILDLIGQSYPSSKIELMFMGEVRFMPTFDILRKLRFKSIKTIPHFSDGGLFPHVARLAQGKYVIFIQADCRPSRHWIKRIVSDFNADNGIGIILGEVQWRTSDPRNKIGNYCEQIGLDAVWQRLGTDSPAYLTLKKYPGSVDLSIEPVVPLLLPTNMAFRWNALVLVSKAPHSVHIGLTREEIDTIENRKMRVFFEPAAIVDRCPAMNMKKIMKKMEEQAFQAAAWSRFGKTPEFRFRLQMAGEHELVIPFPISIDISWGDFHWIHLWGGALLWKTLWMCLFGRETATAWDMDLALFDASLCGFFAFRYFLPVLKIQPWSDFILWCWLRYRSNMSMFLGGLKASLKFRCFLWSESW